MIEALSLLCLICQGSSSILLIAWSSVLYILSANDLLNCNIGSQYSQPEVLQRKKSIAQRFIYFYFFGETNAFWSQELVQGRYEGLIQSFTIREIISNSITFLSEQLIENVDEI